MRIQRAIVGLWGPSWSPDVTSWMGTTRRFADGAHVLPASATAPTCRPLSRRCPRAVRFVGGALCRPLVRRRPRVARFCGGALVPPASAVMSCAARSFGGAHVSPAPAAAPLCGPLRRRRPRAACSCGGALEPHAPAVALTCRPLLRRRPFVARPCDGGMSGGAFVLPAPAAAPLCRSLLLWSPRAVRQFAQSSRLQLAPPRPLFNGPMGRLPSIPPSTVLIEDVLTGRVQATQLSSVFADALFNGDSDQLYGPKTHRYS